MRSVTKDIEWTEAYAGTEEIEKIIPGLRDASRVVIEAVACDRGELTGAAVETAQFKAFPGNETNGMGGDSFHSFVMLDTFQRNSWPFRFEIGTADLRMVTKRGSAGSLRWCVRRTAYYET